MKGSYLARWATPSTTGAARLRDPVSRRRALRRQRRARAATSSTSPPVVDGDYVYLFGTGAYRASPVHLGAQAARRARHARRLRALRRGSAPGAPRGARSSPRQHRRALGALLRRHRSLGDARPGDRGTAATSSSRASPTRPRGRGAIASSSPTWAIPRSPPPTAASTTTARAQRLFNCDRAGFYGTYLLPEVARARRRLVRHHVHDVDLGSVQRRAHARDLPLNGLRSGQGRDEGSHRRRAAHGHRRAAQALRAPPRRPRGHQRRRRRQALRLRGARARSARAARRHRARRRRASRACTASSRSARICACAISAPRTAPSSAACASSRRCCRRGDVVTARRHARARAARRGAGDDAAPRRRRLPRARRPARRRCARSSRSSSAGRRRHAPCSIQGETGTGKERVAEALHLSSPRAQAAARDRRLRRDAGQR